MIMVLELIRVLVVPDHSNTVANQVTYSLDTDNQLLFCAYVIPIIDLGSVAASIEIHVPVWNPSSFGRSVTFLKRPSAR